MHPLEVAAHLRGILQSDDVIVLDGGEFAQWIRLGLRDIPNRVLWNSKFGGIGGSIPMAIGVCATGHPGRTIVLLGDGAAGYHLSELETAVRYAIPFTAIIGDDALGSRMVSAGESLRARADLRDRIVTRTIRPGRHRAGCRRN